MRGWFLHLGDWAFSSDWVEVEGKGGFFDSGASVFSLVTPRTCECLSADWARSNYPADSRWKQTARPSGVSYPLWPAAIIWSYSLFNCAEGEWRARGGGKRFVSLCPLLYVQRGESSCHPSSQGLFLQSHAFIAVKGHLYGGISHRPWPGCKGAGHV